MEEVKKKCERESFLMQTVYWKSQPSVLVYVSILVERVCISILCEVTTPLSDC